MRKETLARGPSTSAPRGKIILVEEHFAGLLRGGPAFIIGGCDTSESLVELLSKDSVHEEDQSGQVGQVGQSGPEEPAVVGPRTGPTLEEPAVAGGGVKGKRKVIQ